MGITYALYPSKLSHCNNKYVAMVQGQETKYKDDIIEDMLQRGSGITKAEALSVLEAFEASVVRALSKGHRVNTPLFNIAASIKGVFDNEDETINPGRHKLCLNMNPGNRVEEIKNKVELEKIPAVPPMPVIQKFKDIGTGTINSKLTPGGVAETRGKLLKTDEKDPRQGIFFISAGGNETKVDKIIRNKPGNLVFMVPGNLEPGEYELEVRTILFNTRNLRIGCFGYPLRVE